MSSSRSSDEFVDEGRGYANDSVESSSLVSSSILGSDDDNTQRGSTSEGDMEMDVDGTCEWVGDVVPPIVEGYKWAPHEIGLYAPFFITDASIEYLVGQVSLLSRLRNAEHIKLIVCR